jgi:hypothetical protein
MSLNIPRVGRSGAEWPFRHSRRVEYLGLRTAVTSALLFADSLHPHWSSQRHRASSPVIAIRATSSEICRRVTDRPLRGYKIRIAHT